MNSIACCHFPTTLFVLDDDQGLLKNIKYAFSSKYRCVCTHDIDKGHEILIKNRGWVESFLQGSVNRIFSDEDPSIFSVSMNFSLLKNLIYDVNRFKHIAIAIVDYDMPEKNGLEFVRSLDDRQIKIIMLTGKAEQATVIKAFNEKEIHRYISKGDPDYLNILFQYIRELQDEFFFDFSKFILDSLRESETTVLENKNFIKLFNETIHENDIVEYYLLDESGSFLMLDAAGQSPVWLIVKSEENMKHFYDLAKDDPDTPDHVLKQLKERQSITHFKTAEEGIAQAKFWHLFPAQPLDEKKEFYFAVIKNNPSFQLDPHVQSYDQFLKQDLL